MKKMSFEYILYMIQITVIGIFLVVCLSYQVDMRKQDFFTRNMYSGYVTGIYNSDKEPISLKIPEKKKEDFACYKVLSDGYDEDIRAIYETRGDLFGMEQLLEEGRFFSEEDYSKKNHVAVIGKELLPVTVQRQDGRYYGYNKQWYRVIGVFASNQTHLDHTVYLNLSAVLQEETHDGLYFVDGLSEQAVREGAEGILQQDKEKNALEEVGYQSNVSYEFGGENTTLFYASLLALFCEIGLTCVCFTTRKEYELAVYRLCGCTKWDLFLKYGKRLLSITLCVFAGIACFFQWFTSKWGDVVLERYSWKHLALSGSCLGAICLVTNIGMLILSQRKNAAAILKKE